MNKAGLVLFAWVVISGCSKAAEIQKTPPQPSVRKYTADEIKEGRQNAQHDHLNRFATGSNGGQGWVALFTGEPDFHALHYTVDMTFPPASLTHPAFDGWVELTFRPTREKYQVLTLDSSALQIQKVTLLNQFQELRFEQKDEKVEIDLNQPYGPNDTLTVTIQYHWDGATGKAVYFESRDLKSEIEAIYTQSEPDTSKNWFPSNSYPNDRASFESFVHVPAPFVAVSNGALSGSTEQNGMKTYHWSMKMPMASYLFVVTAGRFATLRDTWDGIPVEYYGQADDTERLKYSLRGTPDMLGFLSEKTGFRYPYEKYAQTVVPHYPMGGMEHTTATTLTDDTLHTPAEDSQYSSESLVTHEMAHQWFGDLVTCKSWDHLWLNEGFATYFDALYQESRHGRAAYLKTLVGESAWYFSEEDKEARPVVFPYYHTSLDDYFDSHAYAKGAWALHMLRNTLGDDVFFKGIKSYLVKNQAQVVKTEDFRQAMEETSGKNLYWFFDQWLMKPGYPDFKIIWAYDTVSKEVVLTVEQTQNLSLPGGIQGTVPLFEGPIQVEVAGEATKEPSHKIKVPAKNYTVVLSGKTAPTPGREIFRFSSEKVPAYVKFNSGNGWLAKINMVQRLPQWIAQLMLSADIAARVEASHALAQRKWVRDTDPDTEFKIAAHFLEDCAHTDPDLWGRQTCTKDLGEFVTTAIAAGMSKTHETIVYVRDGLFELTLDAEWSVREAAAKSLAELPIDHTEATLPVLENIISQDDAVRVTVAAVATAGTLGAALDAGKIYEEAYNILISQLGRSSFHNDVREAALEGLAHFADPRSIQIGKEFAEPRYAESTRKVAFELLAGAGAKTKDIRDDARVTLESWLKDHAASIRRSVIAALVTLGDPKAIPALEAVAANDPSERVRDEARKAVVKLKG